MDQDVLSPQVDAFLVCSDIFLDEPTNRFLIVHPAGHIPATEFPLSLRICIYAQLHGGHGRCALTLSLRDRDGVDVWECQTCEIEQAERILPHKINLRNLPLEVPQPGRYDMILYGNGHEIGCQPLWIGPREFFTG